MQKQYTIQNSEISPNRVQIDDKRCSGRDLNPGSATRKAAMLDRIVQLLLLLHHRSFNLSIL